MSFFNNKAVGLDISDHTIELVQLKNKGTNYQIVNSNRVSIAPDIVRGGRIKDVDQLKKIVNSLFETAKPAKIDKKDIIFGLPESLVYIHNFKLTTPSLDNIDERVRQESLSHIPIDEDNLVYTHKVISKQKDFSNFLIAAMDIKILKEWQDFFKTADIDIETFDIEALAILRGLNRAQLTYPTLIVDIGAISSSINVFDKDGLRYSHTILVAGEALTHAVAESMGLEERNKAEEVKVKLGLSDPTSRESVAMVKVLESIAYEVKQIKKYAKNKFELEVSSVVLVGGSSLLPGISNYFSDYLEIPVSVGQSSVPNEGKSSLLYLEAIGLAMRSLLSKFEDDLKFPRIIDD